MWLRRVVVVGVFPFLCGALQSGTALAAAPRSAPTITGLAATPASVTTLNGGSTISASVTHASSCTLSAKPAVVSGSGTFTCSKTTPVSQTLKFPENTSSTLVFYKITLKASGAGGTTNEAKQTIKVSVAPGAGELSPPLSGIEAVVGDGSGFTFCALLASGTVDCWGDGSEGELGNGVTDTQSSMPVQVEGVRGIGTLSSVASLTGDNETFCALLTSGGIDCWGAGIDGELGNGSFTPRATPVPVVGVGGTGTLRHAASLTGTDGTLCALHTSGKVDCWGDGFFGQLGNGIFYTKPDLGSATPVHVGGVGGTGTLSGVTSLTGHSNSVCAVLTSGGVDCWGSGYLGQLGNGATTTKATPVHVGGVGGTGTLSGVTSLTDGFDFYCALLTSGGVDCWGRGDEGELGDGSFSGSDTPVQVKGVGGTSTLGGVASLTGDFDSYCGLLTSGGVDCWGYGFNGQLGDARFYSTGSEGSDTPVQVKDVGGTGILGGVTSLTEGTYDYCALLVSGELDCWGYGIDGELGDGVVYGTSPFGRNTPDQVEGVAGIGTLSGVASLTGGEGSDTFCALLTSSGADCWGLNDSGQVGSGSDAEHIVTPVQVVSY
jgi:alpha-tubulin suppressor-like RCC1 family protein